MILADEAFIKHSSNKFISIKYNSKIDETLMGTFCNEFAKK